MLRHCELCEEVFFDNGVDLVQASDHIENGPNEVWCLHCLEKQKTQPDSDDV